MGGVLIAGQDAAAAKVNETVFTLSQVEQLPEGVEPEALAVAPHAFDAVDSPFQLHRHLSDGAHDRATAAGIVWPDSASSCAFGCQGNANTNSALP